MQRINLPKRIDTPRTTTNRALNPTPKSKRSTTHACMWASFDDLFGPWRCSPWCSGGVVFFQGSRFPLLVFSLVLCLSFPFGSGCTKTVSINDTFPAPLIEALSLTVGVYYDQALLDFAHVDTAEDSKWVVEFGSAHKRLFDQLFRTLFRQVVAVEGKPFPPPKSAHVDAIIIPSFEDIAFVTPENSGVDFYEVSLRYRVALHRPSGALIDAWSVNGYGRHPYSKFNSSRSVSEATTLAMRDAAAQIAIEFQSRPEVKDLLVEKRSLQKTTP